MSENLLLNPGFEDAWNGNQRCHVFPADDVTAFDNILVPNKWTAWFFHDPGTWDKPEVHEVHRAYNAARAYSGDSVRIHSGEKAMLLFTFCRRHLAGFYQQVYVEPGARLRLSAYAHAWSNHNIEGHDRCTNNPRCSVGVGEGAYFCLEKDAPLLNGDPWNDAIQNFLFSVGIDPTGGVNPFVDVVWGPGAHIYNEHARVPVAEVVVPAGPGLVTVFLRSATLWAFENNNAYWDTVKLESIDGRSDVPRVQYDRTYILLPPGADRGWVYTVAEAVWDKHRYTIGGSADDAGLGDLDNRCVVAVNPGLWPGDLEAFFEEHYSGVAYEFVEVDTPSELYAWLIARG